jgi:ParB-like nuclease domain
MDLFFLALCGQYQHGDERMKLKLTELNSNPFKKEINEGKLDKETVSKIRANIKELGLMGALPVFRKDNKYYLIAGHHRVEALKQEFGKDYSIEVDVKDYSTDQILRGMVVENLTQRDNEHSEETDNIIAIRDYLKDNKMLLDEHGQIISAPGARMKSCRADGRGGKTDEPGSPSQISLWLDKGSEYVMSIRKICNLIKVHEELSPALKKKTHKVSGSKAPDDVVTVKQAEALVTATNDHKEQEALWHIMKKEEEGRPHELLKVYNKLEPEQKKEVLAGKLELSDLKKGLPDIKNNAEMALTFHKKATALILEMRNLRSALYQFRKQGLYTNFTPKQRVSFRERLGKVSETYDELIKELKSSIEVLENEG